MTPRVTYAAVKLAAEQSNSPAEMCSLLGLDYTKWASIRAVLRALAEGQSLEVAESIVNAILGQMRPDELARVLEEIALEQASYN